MNTYKTQPIQQESIQQELNNCESLNSQPNNQPYHQPTNQQSSCRPQRPHPGQLSRALVVLLTPTEGERPPQPTLTRSPRRQ